MTDQSARPNQVRLACWLLWIPLLVTFCTSLLKVPNLREQIAFYLLLYISVFGAAAALIFAIWRGKNWARTLFLVLMALGLLVSVPEVVNTFGSNPGAASVTAVLIAMQVAGTLLLFSARAKSWFASS
jgi:hypothetical protein